MLNLPATVLSAAQFKLANTFGEWKKQEDVRKKMEEEKEEPSKSMEGA